MKYMLLIYSESALEPVYGSDEFKSYIEEYGAFSAECEAAGVMVSGQALESIASASKVTAHGGKTLTVDGPFAETKETLGGFYLLDCETREQAEAFAAKIPTARFGSVEVRPVMTFD